MSSNNGIKILGTLWYTNATLNLSCNFGANSTIGIVLIQNEIGEKKAYIGVGKGFSKEADEQHIAEWGSSFSGKAARELFPEHFRDE